MPVYSAQKTVSDEIADLILGIFLILGFFLLLSSTIGGGKKRR